MNAYILGLTEYPTPHFLAYMLNAYHEIGLVSNPLSDFIQEPYAAKIPELFDGKHEPGTINAALTKQLPYLLTPEYRTQLSTNAKFSELRSALKANSIEAWNTTTPTHLYHGEDDEVIPYSMSETMFADFKTRGATDKVLLIPIPKADHTSGVFPTGFQTIFWFLQLQALL
jgi:fermentation-respiration switch protein FrsA (DUF1100 family)